MSLINPAILYGLALAAIPVILHFLLRNKPKRLLFPALRLVQVRRQTNTRRMRLRHIWLLLLRILVIVLLVLALARPSLPAANYMPNWGELLALAGVLAVTLGTYWGVLRLWNRQRLPHHELSYRRALLRGGVGLAALVLVLLLVAWPYQRRISAELAGPRPEVAKNLPVAGVFLFDTSLSMQYQTESKTRLQVAREISQDHLGQLPAGSRIAVGDTSSDGPMIFQPDLLGAQARIDALEIRPVTHSLNDRLRAALRLQEDNRRQTLEEQGAVAEDEQRDRFLREIYLFTDLAQSAWRLSNAQALRNELERLPWVHVYLIDVGVTDPLNVSISSLRLSQQTVSQGDQFVVEAAVDATGRPETEKTVELHVQDAQGNLVKQGQSPVRLGGGTGARASFSVPALIGPVTQGEVRLAGSDPLADDNARYFTVAVRPPPKILVVADIQDEAVFWTEALAPTDLRRQGKARYRVTHLPTSQLAEADLQEYAVVCLVHVERPTEAAWRALADYVRSGGGLAVFLGMRNNPSDPAAARYNGETAQSILPGELLAELKFTPPEYLDVQDLNHPLFRKFEALGGLGELPTVEIERYWRVKPHPQGAVITRYTDSRNSPALLERVSGKGRTIMLTTAVDLEGWNELARTWSFVALADQMMQYLSRAAEGVYNYIAGQEVAVPLDADRPMDRYLLRKPDLRQLPGEVPSGADQLRIADAGQIGHYEIVPDAPDSSFRSGFSVNPPPEESDLSRLTEANLDDLLGEDRYSLSRTTEELARGVQYGRIGQEMFPYVVLFVIMVFALEHIAANRFYDEEQRAEAW